MNYKEKLSFVAKRCGYASLKRYILKSEFIFEDLVLENKRILEIGCGNGEFCMWAGLNKAEYVLGIEPETDGSSEGSLHRYHETAEKLELTNIEAKGLFLNQLEIPQKLFDIILMYNVINHLDEDKVQVLDKDASAAEGYVLLLKELKNFLHPEGIVIVADCARRNFWNDIGLRSPVAKTIEWHKHQNPQQWIKIFQSAGFDLYDFRWSRLYPFGRLASNRLFQYLTASHFVLRFQNK
jgi:SAM-dependent methyltransferase